MKNFKKLTLGLLGVTLLTIGLYSCSSDEESNLSKQTENSILSKKGTSVDAFLKSYYNGQIYKIGREILIENIEGHYKLSEIALDDTERIGYIVEDANTNDFLYFADKNLTTDEMLFENIKTQEKDILIKLSSDYVFTSTKKFDLIYVVDKIKNTDPVALGWGKRFDIDRIWKNNEENCGKSYRDAVEGSATFGQCVKDCTYRSYRFFIGGPERSLTGIPTGDNNC